MGLDMIIVTIVVCFLFGVGLLIVEMFMPGFGVAGISGAGLLIASIVVTWVNFGVLAALGITVVVLAIVGIGISISLKSAASGRLSRSGFILKDTESTDKGYAASADMKAFEDREGVCVTDLRPVGTADFDGVRLSVISDGPLVRKGAHVRVTRVEGSKIHVRALEPAKK